MAFNVAYYFLSQAIKDRFASVLWRISTSTVLLYSTRLFCVSIRDSTWYLVLLLVPALARFQASRSDTIRVTSTRRPLIGRRVSSPVCDVQHWKNNPAPSIVMPATATAEFSLYSHSSEMFGKYHRGLSTRSRLFWVWWQTREFKGS